MFFTRWVLSAPPRKSLKNKSGFGPWGFRLRLYRKLFSLCSGTWVGICMPCALLARALSLPNPHHHGVGTRQMLDVRLAEADLLHPANAIRASKVESSWRFD